MLRKRLKKYFFNVSFSDDNDSLGKRWCFAREKMMFCPGKDDVFLGKR